MHGRFSTDRQSRQQKSGGERIATAFNRHFALDFTF
jgi:hypothetical protein